MMSLTGALVAIFIICNNFASAGKNLTAAGLHCSDLTGFNEDQTRKALDCDPKIEDPKVKCFFKCYLQEIGWMDDDGKMSRRPEGVPLESALSDQADICLNVAGTDDCDLAFNFYKCFSIVFRGNKRVSCD